MIICIWYLLPPTGIFRSYLMDQDYYGKDYRQEVKKK